MIFLPLAILIAGWFGAGYLYVFWGDEYTTRHAGRLRQVLCGSHLRSYLTLVALPMNLGFVVGYLGQYLLDHMFQRAPLFLHTLGAAGVLVILNVLLVHIGKGYRNTFYRFAVSPIVAAYEKGRGVDTEVFTDHLESMFLAARRHNDTAEEVLQSLLDREDELGAQARTIVHMLEAEYSDLEARETVRE